MSMIHPSSLIDPSAQIDVDVQIGPFCIIGPRVTIRSGSVLRSHVSVGGETVIGPENIIHPFCYLGMPPQEVATAPRARARLEIGARNEIRQHVSIALSTRSDRPTRIGDDTLIMGHSHIAHDCEIGDRVVITHGVGLSGHVTIEEGAVLGGQSGAHQFVRIGRYAMIGGKTGVICDIPPFTKVAGLPPRYLGCNRIGLERAGFDASLIADLEDGLERLFSRDSSELERSLELLERSTSRDEVRELITFIRDSERGVCTPRVT